MTVVLADGTERLFNQTDEVEPAHPNQFSSRSAPGAAHGQGRKTHWVIPQKSAAVRCLGHFGRWWTGVAGPHDSWVSSGFVEVRPPFLRKPSGCGPNVRSHREVRPPRQRRAGRHSDSGSRPGSDHPAIAAADDPSNPSTRSPPTDLSRPGRRCPPPGPGGMRVSPACRRRGFRRQWWTITPHVLRARPRFSSPTRSRPYAPGTPTNSPAKSADHSVGVVQTFRRPPRSR